MDHRNLVEGPAKLEIRGDKEAGLIYAWFVMVDEPDVRFEVSTFCYELAQQDRAYYDLWVNGVEAVFKKWVEDVIGLPVARVHTFKPHEGN